MKTIWLCTADIQKEVESQVRPEYLRIREGSMAFSVGIDVDDALEKKISTDDLLANKIFAGISEIYKETLSAVVNVTQGFEARIKAENEGKDPAVDLVLINATPKTWQCVVDSYLTDASDRMIRHAKREIELWKQTRSDRTAYVIREALKISSGIIILTTNITSAAFGGGVLSILGAVKTLVKMLGEIWMLLKKVGEQERQLYTHLAEIVRAYEKGFGATKEVVAAALDEVSGGVLPRVLEFFSAWSSSISQVESDLRIFHEKLAGIEIDASNAGKKLNELLDDQSRINQSADLNDAVKKVNEVLNDQRMFHQSVDAALEQKIVGRLLNGKAFKRLEKLRANLRKLEEATSKKISEMESLYRLIQGFKEREKTYIATLEDLKQKRTGKQAIMVKGFELLFKAGDMIVDASAGTEYGKTDEVIQLITSIETDTADFIADEKLVGAGSPA